MDGVIECTCGEMVPRNRLICLGCNADLTRMARAPGAAPPRQAVGSAGEATATNPHQTDGTRRDNDVAYDTMEVSLVFPWGEVQVGDLLKIGRDPLFSPVAEDLEPFLNVSRRHAEIQMKGRSPQVLDLASTNGTFANENPVRGSQPVVLEDGDVLRFGADLVVTVRIRNRRG